MSIALVVLSLLYFFLFYHLFSVFQQIEKVFSTLNLSQQPNFFIGKIIISIFLVWGVILFIVGISNRLDQKKKKILFVISLAILLFIVGSRLLPGQSVLPDIQEQFYKAQLEDNLTR